MGSICIVHIAMPVRADSSESKDTTLRDRVQLTKHTPQVCMWSIC